MKKKIIIPLFMLLVTLCFSCQAHVNDAEATSNTFDTADILKNTGVESITYDASYYRIYNDPSDLLSDTSCVVLATSHNNISYLEGEAVNNKTKFTINEVLYGDLNLDIIEVYASGGVVPYNEYMKSQNPQTDGSLADNNNYIRVSYGTVDLVKDETRYILFLSDIPNQRGSYWCTGGFMGRYELNVEGTYSRFEPSPDFYEDTADRLLANAKITGQAMLSNSTEHNPSFSIEEIKAIISLKNSK